MKFRVVHRTEYAYAEPVTLCHNETHLTPRGCPGQRLLSHALDVEPTPDTTSRREDYFGNPVVYFAVQTAHPVLRVTATSEIERDGPAAIDDAGLSWEDAVQRTLADRSEAGLDASQHRLDSPMVSWGPDICDYARPSFAPGREVLEAVADLTHRIHRDFAYEPGTTTIATPLARVLAQRRGVCQDFAHVGIACLRSVGLAARYVSGYLQTDPPPGEARLVGADASHAWLSVYLPDQGWVDFDPTNDLRPGDRHITTAWGRDYGDVTPIKGIIFGGGGAHTARVSVDVTRAEGD